MGAGALIQGIQRRTSLAVEVAAAFPIPAFDFMLRAVCRQGPAERTHRQRRGASDEI